jgi:hypothetical protein
MPVNTQVYTVAPKGGFNTDREFQAYIDLLEDIGVDLSKAPRIREPSTQNEWVYVWTNRTQAERFARELGRRLRESDLFYVHGFEIEGGEEERGPLAPLTIRSIPTRKGPVFQLESTSMDRVLRHFPNAMLRGEVMRRPVVSSPARSGEDGWRRDDPEWEDIIIQLTGLDEEAVMQLGGIRILDEDGDILYRRLPEDAPH